MFLGRESCWETSFPDVDKPLGGHEGPFCRTGPRTRLLLSMQRQMPISMALMGSGRGDALMVHCLLRALSKLKL